MTKLREVQTWSLASLYCSERFVYKITEKMQYTIRCKLFSTTFLTPEELSYSEELCSTVYYDSLIPNENLKKKFILKGWAGSPQNN